MCTTSTKLMFDNEFTNINKNWNISNMSKLNTTSL